MTLFRFREFGIKDPEVVSAFKDLQDLLIKLEDSGGSGGSGTDLDAIHDNVANEISAITEKANPVQADLIVIEDSEAANIKKRVQLLNINADDSFAFFVNS